VFSVIAIAFGSATPCKRPARFGVSPVMARCSEAPDPIRSRTTTSPVAMLIRAWSGACVFKLPTAATNSRPTRAASLHRPRAHGRYEAAEALQGLSDALLVGRNDLAEVFRVRRTNGSALMCPGPMTGSPVARFGGACRYEVPVQLGWGLLGAKPIP
jgi:hypothetical protein